MVETTVRKNSWGDRSGTSTERRSLQPVAPSSRAASTMSPGIAATPADRTSTL
ncbi:hypothetical protein ABIA31_005334 [Catenulispora sp. MAP5-51]